MGDECTCEKCRAGSVYFRVAVAWPSGKQDAAPDSRGSSTPDFYLIIGEGGISLRQQSPEL